ncbi:MAG: preprotein translocase subunit SecA [Gammaproteobacteria bacterium]|nr:preprotein translocase subunit SecA [Gammaproteobacteria bacterium]MCF6230041.1 preprotein translocase subunit SecA [Gammaproteobacteria bacterium]
MIGKILNKVFGSRNDRVLKQLKKRVEQINALESKVGDLSDDELGQKSVEFRSRLEQGETPEQILPEAFAVVRESSKRVFKMRHFDVQLIGGIVLNEGKISEMRTGEGKTLMATLPVYLNALTGKGVHIVTVNDYLAKRDAEWMGRLYTFLGLSTGVIYSGQSAEEKRAAYQADITYGTNNEYGFDYLRDNMAFSIENKVQRGLGFAVVDEVDSILIDEARTPLIISGPVEGSPDIYVKINSLIPSLVKQEMEEPEDEADIKDFTVDEKSRQIFLTELGHQKAEDLLAEAGILPEGESLYDVGNIGLVHQLNACLRAHYLYQRNVHYIVRDNEAIIVDEFTGRTMSGRRWSEGLHQAIEAKEGLPIQAENQTLASITFQNYFRLYSKLSGMTGTADTEAFELQDIYGLEVVVIPTNRTIRRTDHGDVVFLSKEEKYQAAVEEIKKCQSAGQPVLVGSSSIEASETLDALLSKAGIKHEVLNAKQHAREAQIIAEAGRPGAVTIATHMAGRGTDIVLGGNFEVEMQMRGDDITDQQREELYQDWQQRHDAVIASGGLHVIGTERNESRRVDNQLRGRSGRQGDPGSSRFYISMEDDLMRIFASDRIANMMQKLGMKEGESIEHPWVSRAIENSQRKVEGHNFDIRKQLLEYDDVANDQRKVIYEQRDELMAAEDISETIFEMRVSVINDVISRFIPPQSLEEQWDVPALEEVFKEEYATELAIQDWLAEDDDLHEEPLREKIVDEMTTIYAHKEEQAGSDVMRRFEKEVMLNVLDHLWKEHLAAMDYLRQGIGLRSYAAKNPKQEYKREAFALFSSLLENIQLDVIKVLSRVKFLSNEDVERVEQERRQRDEVEYKHDQVTAMQSQAEEAGSAAFAKPEKRVEEAQPYVREGQKVGRNDPCPCGSGKKYKRCHGELN